MGNTVPLAVMARTSSMLVAAALSIASLGVVSCSRISSRVAAQDSGFAPGDIYCYVPENREIEFLPRKKSHMGRYWPVKYTDFSTMLEAWRAHDPSGDIALTGWRQVKKGWRLRVLETDWVLGYTKGRVVADERGREGLISDDTNINELNSYTPPQDNLEDYLIYTVPSEHYWSKCSLVESGS